MPPSPGFVNISSKQLRYHYELDSYGGIAALAYVVAAGEPLDKHGQLAFRRASAALYLLGVEVMPDGSQVAAATWEPPAALYDAGAVNMPKKPPTKYPKEVCIDVYSTPEGHRGEGVWLVHPTWLPNFWEVGCLVDCKKTHHPP